MAAGDVHCQAHFREDMARVESGGFGLDTDAGIRRFWGALFPHLPGECCLLFHGDVYSVLYLPRQWGEVKEPPSDWALMW